MGIADRLKRLPQRACVAFAARCAERVLPIFRAGASPSDDVVAASQALILARAVATGQSVTEVAASAAARAATNAATNAIAAAAATTRVANAALAANAEATDAEFEADATANAANAAGQAAQAAANAFPTLAEPTATAATAANAVNAANAAANAAAAHAAANVVADSTAARAEALAASSADLDKLEQLAETEGWDHASPVDPNSLGPLWPNGQPEWITRLLEKLEKCEGEPPGTLWEDDYCQHLVLKIDPGSATDEEIAELLRLYSRVYEARGGSGLNFEFLGVEERVTS